MIPRHRWPSLTFLLLLTGLAAQQPAQQPAPSPERPRLVVLCSVDQLARWVFEQGRPHFAPDGGFRRLLDGGVDFAQCAYQHACTETGPGHATIGTGAPAAVHGIVRNEWWSPEDGGKVYCAHQEAPALPDLPEGKDRGPARLLVPTFGDSLKAHVPGSKVASVSWKDRSAILMAGRSADVAAWFEAKTGNLVTNTVWVEQTPPWIVEWNQKRAIDGFHGWKWELMGPPEAYAGLVDDRPYEVPHQNGSNARTLPQPVTGGKPEPEYGYYAQLYASPAGNTVVRLAAEAAVRGMELGRDAVPDLLCVSFSSTDSIGHQFGPDSVESRDALLRLDRELAEFLSFLDREVGAGKYALFLTADHGVGPTPEWAKQNGVDAGRGRLLGAARSAAETALTRTFGAPPTGKRWFAHVGESTGFFDREVLASCRGERDEATMLREAGRIAAEAAASARGLCAAFSTSELLADGARGDPVREALLHAICAQRAGDVQFVLKPYWLDGIIPASHGTPHPYDREVVALAIGPRLPAGVAVAARITPGFGVVLFSELLGIPRPAGAIDELPQGVLGLR